MQRSQSPHFKFVIVVLLILLVTILSGCSTQGPLVVKEAPRQLPIQAMAKCPDSLPTLPQNLPQLPIGNALALLISAVNESQKEFYLCKAKQERLTDWIESE